MRTFLLPQHIDEMKVIVDDLRRQQEDALGNLQPTPRYKIKYPMIKGFDKRRFNETKFQFNNYNFLQQGKETISKQSESIDTMSSSHYDFYVDVNEIGAAKQNQENGKIKKYSHREF